MTFPLWIHLASFTAVAGLTYVLFSLVDPYWRRVNVRVEEFRGLAGNDDFSAGYSNAKQSQSHWQTFCQNFLPSFNKSPRLQKRLIQAGIYRPEVEFNFLVISILLALVGSLTCVGLGLTYSLDMGRVLPAACVVGALGMYCPHVWLNRAIARRLSDLRKSLPDFLDLMTICLEGGLSLQETIKRVSDELRIAHPTFTAELAVVIRDMELGASVDQALKRFAQRTDYDGLRTLSTFIREAQRFGTNITEALREHADMLRSQREQIAEESAQKAAVKILMPTFLFIFPAIFVVAVGPAVFQIQAAFATK